MAYCHDNFWDLFLRVKVTGRLQRKGVLDHTVGTPERVESAVQNSNTLCGLSFLDYSDTCFVECICNKCILIDK